MTETTKTAATGAGLKSNAISATGIVFLVLAAASPLIGLTGAVPSAMVLGNGNGAPMAYVIVGAILLLFGVGYVAMSRQVTNAGALYAYAGRGLGLPTGVGAAGVALWAYTLVQIAVYAFFGVVASGTFADWFGWDITWWVLSLGLVALVQVFGYLGIELGARVLGVLMALEWSVMIILGLAILFQGGAGEGLGIDEVFNPTVILSGAPGVALVFAFASMFGFESSALYGEEVRDPKRSVPRATYSSVLLITTFFLFMSWMLIVGYGPSNSVAAAGASLESGNPAAYVFDSGATYLGSWAPDAMSIFVLTSMFACNLAFHNAISRYLFTLGRDLVLPGSLSSTRSNGAPHVASVTQTASAVLIMLPFIVTDKDPITTLFFWGSGIAVVGIVTLYILVSIAAFVFFGKHPTLDTRPWNTRIAPALAALILSAALVLIVYNFPTLVGTGRSSANLLALTVVIAFAVGLTAYGLARKRMSPDALADLAHDVT